MTTELRPSSRTRFDDEHDFVFQGPRAWLVERGSGNRVSITWERGDGESIAGFVARIHILAHRVVQFISQAN